jgi:hypothetical protein
MKEVERARKNRIIASVRKAGKINRTLLMITASVRNTVQRCERKHHHSP